MSLLLLRQLFPVTTKTCCGSTMGSPARNGQCLTSLHFHLEIFFSLFILPQCSSFSLESHQKSPQAIWKLAQTSAFRQTHCRNPENNVLGHCDTHTYTHTHRPQKIASQPSVIWFSNTLLHDLPQVWVLHGGSHSFFIINLFVNWRHKLH